MDVFNIFIGKKVLVRTYSAGVHFGILEKRDGKELLLKKAHRIWRWRGALTLSEIAAKGLDIENSQISCEVDAIGLTETIEIIPINSNSNIYAFKN